MLSVFYVLKSEFHKTGIWTFKTDILTSNNII